MDDLAALFGERLQAFFAENHVQEANKDGSGALSVDELRSCIGIVKPRLRGDAQLDNLLDELGAGNGMFGAMAAIKFEGLVEALERLIQARTGRRSSKRRTKKKTVEKNRTVSRSTKAVGMYGKEVLSPLDPGPSAVGKSSRKRRRKGDRKQTRSAIEGNENTSMDINGSTRRPVTDLAHDMYNAKSEDNVRSALGLKQRGASRGNVSENQESSNNISAKVDSESIGRPSTPLANATAMSQLPPSGSKSKLKVSQKLEPQSSSGGIVSRKVGARDRQIILKCLPTAALLTVVKKILHCRLHGLDEQSSVRLLSNDVVSVQRPSK